MRRHQLIPRRIPAPFGYARWLLPALAVLASAQAFAAGAAGSRERAATEGVTVPYLNPAIDTSRLLTGKALVDALRAGGHVLYMRHTEAGKITPECNESNLSTRGERDARFIGESLRSLAIPIGAVATSPVCRVVDTTRRLGLGEFEVTGDLANVSLPPTVDLGPARRKRLATPPLPGTNTLLVSHMQGGKDVANWIYLDFGEIVVFRPANASAVAIARIRADDWYDLIDAATRERQTNNERKPE